MPSDFFPDDGSVIFELFEPSALFGSGTAERWFGGPMGMAMFSPELCVSGVVLLYQEKAWGGFDDEVDPEPEWGEEVLIDSSSLLDLHNRPLSSKSIKKEWVDEVDEEPRVRVEYQFTKTRWRLAWPMPEHSPAAGWHFVHLRLREATVTIIESGEPGEPVGGPLLETWWQGEEPEGYDVGIEGTWPCTTLRTTEPPSVPDPSDPDEVVGDFRVNVAATRLGFLWPTPGWLENGGSTPGPESGYQFPGFVPGGRGILGDWERPHSIENPGRWVIS